MKQVAKIKFQKENMISEYDTRDLDLEAGKGTGHDTPLLQRQGQKGDGDLLTGGDQGVHFPLGRVAGDLAGQSDQAVGFPAHGGYDNYQLVAITGGRGNLVGNGLDPLHRSNRGAPVFFDDECQK